MGYLQMAQLSKLTRPNPNISDAEPGYYQRRGSFQGGGIIETATSIIFNETNQHWYQYIGTKTLPFVVVKGTAVDGNWQDVGDGTAPVKTALNVFSTFSFTDGAVLKAVNNAIYHAGTKRWYFWNGAYPKTVNPGSSPVTEGIAIDKWMPFEGVASYNIETAYGADVIKYLPPGAGAVDRQLTSKLRENVRSITDYGAVGDNSTDDTAAIQKAIDSLGTSGGTLLVPKNPDGSERRFLFTSITNQYGVKFAGEGALVYNAPQGGQIQVNTYANDTRVWFGSEYLYRAFVRIRLGQQMKVNAYGDSTVEGGYGETDQFKVGALLQSIFDDRGIDVTITNKGIGGTSFYQNTAVNDLTSSTDLFIFKYGINDGGTPGTGDRLENFAKAMRAKLSEIRANQYGSIVNLSIILVGPNSTNDSQHGRDELWYEKLRSIYVQTARDFQCAYFDTYSLIKDVRNAAGVWMDDPFSNGIAIHPRSEMNTWIWGNVIDAFFPVGSQTVTRLNAFLNIPSSHGFPSSSNILSNYHYGRSQHRARPNEGFPIDGALDTMRTPDNAGRQIISGYSVSTKVLSRVWNPATNAWTPYWTGQAIGLSPANNWIASISSVPMTPEVRISQDGLVTIGATLSGGTTATGTTILTGLPAEMRPSVDRRFICANNDGTLFSVGVNSNGNIFLVGNAASQSGIHVNLSYYV